MFESISRGECGEVSENGRATEVQSFEGVVAGGDERAVDTQFAGDFAVVQRVTDEEDSGGSDGEAADEIVAEGEFAVGVDVIESGDVVEVGGEAEMLDDFVQGFVTVSGEDRLAKSGVGRRSEDTAGSRMEGAFEAPRLVAGNEFDAQALEAVFPGVEAEAFIVGAHRKIEERMIALAVKPRELAAVEEAIHHFDGEIEVVEERAVPIPDNVVVAREWHGAKTLWTAACDRRNLPVMSDVKSPEIRRWKCVCAYDGTGFTGWQSQAGGRGVQDVIEARLAEIFGLAVRIYGSGRTDAGVHARGQVFHFDAVWPHGADRLCKALRCGLPGTIQVRGARVVAADFHSRVQATRKRYVYHVHLGEADPFTKPYCVEMFRPLDFAGMEAAAAVLRGKHDFRAFTALNGTERENAVRTVSRLEITRRGRQMRITAEAEGFLYKMVRSLVGALLAVGEGRLTAERVRQILESKERTALVKTAPPQGLFLDRVFYS